MNMICPKCGADLNKYIGGNIKFCWSCGYKFSNNEGAVSSNHFVPAGDLSNDINARPTQNRSLSIVPVSNNSLSTVPTQNRNLSMAQNPNMNHYMAPAPNPYPGSSPAPNLIISYYSAHPRVYLVVKVVSTGYRKVFVNGEKAGFSLIPGPQSLILKIGKKNYRRDIIIPPNGDTVNIQASWGSGVARINILNRERNPIPPLR